MISDPTARETDVLVRNNNILRCSRQWMARGNGKARINRILLALSSLPTDRYWPIITCFSLLLLANFSLQAERGTAAAGQVTTDASARPSLLAWMV